MVYERVLSHFTISAISCLMQEMLIACQCECKVSWSRLIKIALSLEQGNRPQFPRSVPLVETSLLTLPVSQVSHVPPCCLIS